MQRRSPEFWQRPLWHKSWLALAATGLLALALFTALPSLLAQSLPETKGRTLDGKMVTLPELFHQRATVLVVGFSPKASDESRTWGKRLYTAEQAEGRDDIYGLIMLARVPHFLRGFVASSIRREIAPSVQSHYVTLSDNEEAWRSLAQVSSPDEAYLLVVDGQGKVCWRGHGEYSKQALSVVQEELRKANQSGLRAAASSSAVLTSSTTMGN